MADYTTTTNAGLPGFVVPYAEGYLQRAQQVADTPYQAYGGQRVADMNPWQTQAYQAQAQRAASGSPVMSAANQTLTSTINGGFLGGNPYLQNQIDAAQGDLTRQWNNVQKPQWDTAMGQSGSFGNSGVMQAGAQGMNTLQQNMGRIGSDMRFNAYNTERANQQAALSMAPTYAANDYNDINQMQQAGAGIQGQNQKQLDSGYQQFLEARNYPQTQLDIMGNALGRSYGQTSTSTQPGPSTASQLAGGALTGAALYNLLFSGG